MKQDQKPTADDVLGMAWWNRLSKRDRARWSREAGNTGRAKDAWEAFKRQAEEAEAVRGSSRLALCVTRGVTGGT
jgi:hypothetical protein